MGQHKFNPNCQLAKEGKLPPKKPKISKRRMEQLVLDYIRSHPDEIVINEETEDYHGTAQS